VRYITDDIFLKEVGDTLAAAAREGRDHDVIRDGMLLYLATLSDDRGSTHNVPLVFVHSAIERILSRTGDCESSNDPAERECSFCGLKPPEVRLGAGPKAYICDRCVSMFAEIFKEEKPA